MYISQSHRGRALAGAISKLHTDSFEYVGELKDSYEFTEDCKGVVIVGCPELIFGPEENYWNFLNKANKSNAKVVGISITKKRVCYPNNNKGIGKVIVAGRRKIKDLVKELSDFFDEEG